MSSFHWTRKTSSTSSCSMEYCRIFFVIVLFLALGMPSCHSFRFFDTDQMEGGDELTEVTVSQVTYDQDNKGLDDESMMPVSLDVAFRCRGRVLAYSLYFNVSTNSSRPGGGEEQIPLLTQRSQNDHVQFDNIPILFANDCRAYRDVTNFAAFLAIRDRVFGSYKLFGSFAMGGKMYNLQPYNGSVSNTEYRQHVTKEMPELDFSSDEFGISSVGLKLPKKGGEVVEEFPYDDVFKGQLVDSGTGASDVLEEESLSNGFTGDNQTEPLAPVRYEVEVILVCDFLCYTDFQSMYGVSDPVVTKNVIGLFFSYIRAVYKTAYGSILTNFPVVNMDIDIAIPALFIADSPDIQIIGKYSLEGVDRGVDSDPSRFEFAIWVQDSMQVSLKADHYALVTGYDLVGQRYQTGVIGQVTRIPSICDIDSVSVNELRPILLGTILAHELGHSLGAIHDSLTGGLCSDDDAFIMAAGAGGQRAPELEANLLSFSFCSVFTFEALLHSKECVSRTDFEAEATNIPDETYRVGQELPVDSQCATVGVSNLFSFSRTETTKLTGSWDRLCSNIICTSINEEGELLRATLTAFEYTSCGSGRWCRAGSCVDSPDAPITPVDCPAGDDPLEGCDVTRCTGATAYDDETRFIKCCETCKPIFTERFVLSTEI